MSRRHEWYELHLRRARLGATICEASSLTLAASVPVGVAAHVPVVVTAALGLGSAVATGLNQIFGWRRNWLSFGRTLLAIEREVVRYEQGVGPYRDSRRADAAIADAVEGLVATETEAWAKTA